jgi:hypothetical protein
MFELALLREECARMCHNKMDPLLIDRLRNGHEVVWGCHSRNLGSLRGVRLLNNHLLSASRSEDPIWVRITDDERVRLCMFQLITSEHPDQLYHWTAAEIQQRGWDHFILFICASFEHVEHPRRGSLQLQVEYASGRAAEYCSAIYQQTLAQMTIWYHS